MSIVSQHGLVGLVDDDEQLSGEDDVPTLGLSTATVQSVVVAPSPTTASHSAGTSATAGTPAYEGRGLGTTPDNRCRASHASAARYMHVDNGLNTEDCSIEGNSHYLAIASL